MGFCYNNERVRESSGRSPPASDNKKKVTSMEKIITKVSAKQQRRKLSTRDLNFLKSIGLRIRE